MTHISKDINECSNSNGGCEQVCLNEEPYFSCSCYNGFQLYNSKFCSGLKCLSCYFYYSYGILSQQISMSVMKASLAALRYVRILLAAIAVGV